MMSDKKIALFIDSPDSGGAENVVLSLARYLIQESISVEILHFRNAWIGEAAEKHSIPHVALDDKYFRKSYLLPFFSRYLSNVLRDRQVTVLHSHLYGAITGGALAAKLAGIRHIGTLHDRYSLLDGPMRIPLLRVASLLGTTLVSVSHDILKTVESRSVFRWRNFHVVHNGVPIDQINRRTGGSHVTERDDIVKIVFVGRLVPLKRVDLLINAAAKLSDHTKFNVNIVGDGPLSIELEKLISDHALDGTVQMSGYRDDVDRILANSDCFVLPSDTEGLSCSIMEAMVAGIPTIACDVGGNSELIRNGISGWLIPPNDVDALSHALELAIDSDDLRHSAGRHARFLAESLFSLDQMTKKYSAHYFG